MKKRFSPEGHHNCTEVDLDDLLEWTSNNQIALACARAA